MSRLETGVVQEGDDWPGVFIRGDNALWWSLQLSEAAANIDTTNLTSALLKSSLEDLAKLLGSCNAREKVEPQMIVRCTVS